jgi:hypothetical protein
MMDNTPWPGRDPELGAALRGAYGEVPEVDFDALRGSIVAQAELPLARARRAQQRRPWQGRFRSLVPLAAAAGIAGAALAVGVGPLAHRSHPTEHDRQQVEQILNESLPDVGDLVSGQAGSDAVLQGAIGS